MKGSPEVGLQPRPCCVALDKTCEARFLIPRIVHYWRVLPVSPQHGTKTEQERVSNGATPYLFCNTVLLAEEIGIISFLQTWKLKCS